MGKYTQGLNATYAPAAKAQGPSQTISRRLDAERCTLGDTAAAQDVHLAHPERGARAPSGYRPSQAASKPREKPSPVYSPVYYGALPPGGLGQAELPRPVATARVVGGSRAAK